MPKEWSLLSRTCELRCPGRLRQGRHGGICVQLWPTHRLLAIYGPKISFLVGRIPLSQDRSSPHDLATPSRPSSVFHWATITILVVAAPPATFVSASCRGLRAHVVARRTTGGAVDQGCVASVTETVRAAAGPRSDRAPSGPVGRLVDPRPRPPWTCPWGASRERAQRD